MDTRGGALREFFLRLVEMYSLKARAACVSAKSVSYKNNINNGITLRCVRLTKKSVLISDVASFTTSFGSRNF